MEKCFSNAALIRFLEPIDVNGLLVEYAVIQVRLEGASLDNLEIGESFLCNLTAQLKEKAISADPLDLSWWRGGNAVITTCYRLR